MTFGFATEQLSSVIVRAGGEVTLPCENVIRDQVECDSTDWIFSHHGKIEDLVKSGRICGESAKDKSKRLKVTENCSLVITEVTAADGGRYDCQQIKSGQQHAEDALVYLSAVEMTEDKVDDEVRFSCSVPAHELTHAVKCLFEDPSVAEDGGGEGTPSSSCTATVPASRLEQRPKRGHDGSSGRKTQLDKKTGQSLNPTETKSGADSSRDTADPEEAVCYASVSYVKKTNSEGRARVKEDEGDAVTYSAVKAASSAPADPSMSVYATVSKPEPNRDHSA
ncbi:Hypothetical protein SMAX5B_000210 [Scophthalmus maximus]|uniref:Ig-like domain-containing protein n=1 Tax=Scophthalmus maximus TaxID=52904 RepID=A0A2U9CXN1_SCOMX|nr:Hypothetical protein SMAX5B_000210 [Scophthalmus maximus]